MKLKKITDWLDRTLNVAAFDDVSNNGVQISRRAEEVAAVAFAVDGSVRTVRAAVEAGAQLLVVHHGISWGGGIRRVSGGVGEVIRAAIESDLALYACHLPLDAHPTLGNNAGLVRLLKLTHVRPAFSYHGNVIGFVGRRTKGGAVMLGKTRYDIPAGLIGVCSGGAGEFAEAAKNMGCAAFLTGEADWGDVIAAENAGIPLICAGHYETEVFGVRALSREMARKLKVTTIDLTEALQRS